jgi:hypothetical protein
MLKRVLSDHFQAPAYISTAPSQLATYFGIIFQNAHYRLEACNRMFIKGISLMLQILIIQSLSDVTWRSFSRKGLKEDQLNGKSKEK